MQSPRDSRRCAVWLGLGTLAVVVLAVGLTVAIALNQRSSSSSTPAAPGAGTLAPTVAPTVAPTTAAPTVSGAPTATPTSAPTVAPTVNLSEAAVAGGGAGVNGGMVAGVVVGVLAALVVMGALAVVWHRRRGQPHPRDGEQSVSLDEYDPDSLMLVRRTGTSKLPSQPPPPPPPRRHRPASVIDANEEDAGAETYDFPDAGAWADALLLQQQLLQPQAGTDAYSQPGGMEMRVPPGGQALALMERLERLREARYLSKRMRRTETRRGGPSASSTDIENASDAQSTATRATLWSARSRTSEPLGRQRQHALRILTDEAPLPPESRPRGAMSEAAGAEQDRRRMAKNSRKPPRRLRAAAHRARRAVDDAQIDLLASVKNAYDNDEDEDDNPRRDRDADASDVDAEVQQEEEKGAV